MTSEWILPMASVETEPNEVDGQNSVIDLDLFPDLQPFRFGQDYKRSVSKDSLHNNGSVSDDDELLNYFTKADVNQRNKMSKPKVKVVRLREDIANSGRVLIVQEQNMTRVESVGKGSKQPNTVLMPGATSPTSSLEDTQMADGTLCMSKNAIAARENRQRKKEHIDQLVKSVDSLSTENALLQKNVANMKDTIESLHLEVKYLRSVLANQSTLTKLLENIPMVPGLSVSKSEVIGSASKTYTKSLKRQFPESDEEAMLESDDDCDCHPQKNVCKCSKENRYGKRTISEDNNSESDHSYATEGATTLNKPTKSTRSLQKVTTRSQAEHNDDMSGGVCLHVSGSSVSLEFCSSCSRQSAAGKKNKKQ